MFFERCDNSSLVERHHSPDVTPNFFVWRDANPFILHVLDSCCINSSSPHIDIVHGLQFMQPQTSHFSSFFATSYHTHSLVHFETQKQALKVLLFVAAQEIMQPASFYFSPSLPFNPIFQTINKLA